VRSPLAAVVAAAFLATGCLGIGEEGPPDRVDTVDLPLAPGLEILTDIEDCTPGTPGETPGSCVHNLIVAGPGLGDAPPEALVAAEAKHLRAEGWDLMRNRKTAVEGSDPECEFNLGLDTPDGYLRIVGRKPDPLFPGSERPETTRFRAELLRLSGARAVMVVDFQPYGGNVCEPE
jgi:hypothetical protein